MSGRYSAFALLRQGFAGHQGWPQAWRKAKPKPAYDFVLVGGHGLATAYYLAKTHKRSRVCVRRALGSGQVREKLPLMTQSLDSRYLPNGGVWH